MGTRTYTSRARWTRERLLLARHHNRTWKMRINEAAGVKPSPQTKKRTLKGEVKEFGKAAGRELWLLLREFGRSLLKAAGLL